MFPPSPSPEERRSIDLISPDSVTVSRLLKVAPLSGWTIYFADEGPWSGDRYIPISVLSNDLCSPRITVEVYRFLDSGEIATRKDEAHFESDTRERALMEHGIRVELEHTSPEDGTKEYQEICISGLEEIINSIQARMAFRDGVRSIATDHLEDTLRELRMPGGSSDR